jgi:hypothetical protein
VHQPALAAAAALLWEHLQQTFCWLQLLQQQLLATLQQTLQQTLLEGVPLLPLLLLRLLLAPCVFGQVPQIQHDCEAWLLLLLLVP